MVVLFRNHHLEREIKNLKDEIYQKAFTTLNQHSSNLNAINEYLQNQKNLMESFKELQIMMRNFIYGDEEITKED